MATRLAPARASQRPTLVQQAKAALRVVLTALPIALIWIYRAGISPFLGPNCRYQPTCSAYAIDALRHHGLIRGGWMAIRRISRCHPWGGHGFDPVPNTYDPHQHDHGSCCSPPKSPQVRD